MNAADPLGDLCKELKELKEKGQTVVPIDGLLEYLDKPGPAELEVWRETCRRQRMEYQATVQQRVELFRSAMTAAHGALKSAILINGGAAVAVLAFVGSLVQHGATIRGFGSVLAIFAFGAFLGALASGGAYLAQRFYSYDKQSTGDHWAGASMLCTVLAYVAFLSAAIIASFIIP